MLPLSFFFRKFNPTQLSFNTFFNIFNTFCSFQPLSNVLLKGWKLQKILIILKNAYKNCAELIFLQKTALTHIFSSTSGVQLCGSKDFRFWNVIMHWIENVLKIFLKTHGIASYSNNFSHLSKDTFVSDLVSCTCFIYPIAQFAYLFWKSAKQFLFYYNMII